MTTDELVQKFNPANAVNLGEADLLQMRELTDEQITALAKAYPNDAQRKPYLILYDKNLAANKQLYQMSTWQNLNNVRKFANRKNLIPYTFEVLFRAMRNPQTSRPAQRTTAPARKVTVDLSAEAAARELNEAVTKRAAVSPSAKKSAPAATDGKVAAGKKQPAKAAAPKKAAAAKANKTEVPGAEGNQGTGSDTEFSSGTDE